MLDFLLLLILFLAQAMMLSRPLPPAHRPVQVEPKRQELAEANAKLEQANVTLSAVQTKVAQLNEQVRRAALPGPSVAAGLRQRRFPPADRLQLTRWPLPPSHPLQVRQLEEQFAAAVAEKEDAIRQSERCQLKLQLANRLITALASEGEHAAAATCRVCALHYRSGMSKPAGSRLSPLPSDPTSACPPPPSPAPQASAGR